MLFGSCSWTCVGSGRLGEVVYRRRIASSLTENSCSVGRARFAGTCGCCCSVTSWYLYEEISWRALVTTRKMLTLQDRNTPSDLSRVGPTRWWTVRCDICTSEDEVPSLPSDLRFFAMVATYNSSTKYGYRCVEELSFSRERLTTSAARLTS